MKPRSAPDLVRSIYLLWGRHPAPGRSGLTVEKIVDAGIALADEEGLTATSMRKVAQRLGTSAMSLYNYVPSKEDLSALMVDRVNGEVYESDAPFGASDWQTSLRSIARYNWELYLQHPWLLDIRDTRPALGPGISRKYELELRVLEGIGLDDIEMDSTLTLLLSIVQAAARVQADARTTQEESGMTDLEWWSVISPVLEHVMSDGEYPVSARVGYAVGTAYQGLQDTDHALSFGVETLIDGVRARLRAKNSAGVPAPEVDTGQ